MALEPAAARPAGNRAAARVEALFRQHYGRIVSMLARLTGDRPHSEEIASDVFHKRWQRPALLTAGGDLAAWIYRVATNAGLDGLRTNSRRRQREEAAASDTLRLAGQSNALDRLLAEGRPARVRAVLGSLKPRDSQLLLLRSGGGGVGRAG